MVTTVGNMGESYFAVGRGKVAYSQQIDELVIADYDSTGAVIGLEFLAEEVAKDRDKYLALANQKTLGAQKHSTPPEATDGKKSA